MKLRRTIITSTLALSIFSQNATPGGLPVFDGVLNAEVALQYAQQMIDYANQVKQLEELIQSYEQDLKNSISPAIFVYDFVQDKIQKIENIQYLINGYKQRYGSLQALLDRYGNTAFYRSSPCYNIHLKCSPEDQQRIIDDFNFLSESQKTANDDLLRIVDQAASDISEQADKLSQLQDQLKASDGHQKSLIAIGEINAHMASQLLQLRQLLGGMAADQAAKLEAEQDKAARSEALARAMSDGLNTAITKDNSSYSMRLK